jgi:hypothetical protein
VPEIHEIWIDIGAKTKKEALERVAIGDVATYDHEFELIHGSIGTARAFDNKVGRLHRRRNADPPRAGGEETRRQGRRRGHHPGGNRRARRDHLGLCRQPAHRLAVDVGHATDHPDCDNRKYGETKLGGGPIICRGPNINPKVYDRLVGCAKKLKIPYQLEATRAHRHRRPRHPDGRGGVATDWSASRCATCTRRARSSTWRTWSCVKLFVEFAKSLEKGDYAHW